MNNSNKRTTLYAAGDCIYEDSIWGPGGLAEELMVELILELIIEATCGMHLAV